MATNQTPSYEGQTLGFGKHKDMLWTRCPIGYLKWLLNQQDMPKHRKDIAQAELDRRGTVTPDLDVSGHAIDRASLHCRKIWHETKRDGEGIYSWLCRVARHALDLKDVDEQGRYHHLGMRFAFEDGAEWPVLKTVMRDKNEE